MGANSVALYRREIEDFCTTIRTVGFNENDFSLRYVQWSRTDKPEGVPIDLIIVKRQSTGIEKAYAADPSATWLLAFFDDLRTGFFGRNERLLGLVRDAGSELESEHQ